MTRGGCLIALFLAVACGVCVAQSEPQSVADIARRSRTEKKIAATLTDDNFVRRAPAADIRATAGVAASATTASAGEQQSTAPDTALKPAKGDGKTDKAGESQKKEDLKKQLDSFKTERDAWTQSAKRYEDLLANEHDEFRRQMYEDALNNDRKNVSLYQKKIDEAESKTGADTGTDAQKTDQATSGGGKR